MWVNVACVNKAMSTQMMNRSRREKWIQNATDDMFPKQNPKRKEREGSFNVSKPSPLTTKKLAKPSQHHKYLPPPSPKPSLKPLIPLSNKHLLAGYLAHEFLSKGTLFDQPWDPARAEATSISRAGSSRAKSKGKEEKYVRYKEVTEILKIDGAHVPGVVNPTQLGRLLQLG